MRISDWSSDVFSSDLRGTDAADIAPEGVRVRVLNGSGETGQAGGASTDLVAAGFIAAGTGEAERFDIERTVVRYLPGQEAAADLVARHLVGDRKSTRLHSSH